MNVCTRWPYKMSSLITMERTKVLMTSHEVSSIPVVTFRFTLLISYAVITLASLQILRWRRQCEHISMLKLPFSSEHLCAPLRVLAWSASSLRRVCVDSCVIGTRTLPRCLPVLLFVEQRETWAKEVTSFHQTLNRRWRPRKPAVSR